MIRILVERKKVNT